MIFLMNIQRTWAAVAGVLLATNADSMDTNENLPIITRIEQEAPQDPLQQGRLTSKQLHTGSSTVQTQQQQQYVDLSKPCSAVTPKPPSGGGENAQEHQQQQREQTSTGAPRNGENPSLDTEEKIVLLRGADDEQRITDAENLLQWKGQGIRNSVNQSAEDETPSGTAASKIACLEKNKLSDLEKKKIVSDTAQDEKLILEDSSEYEDEVDDVKQAGLPILQSVSREAYEKGWKNSFAFPSPLTEFHAALGGSTVMLHNGNKVTPIASLTLALIKCGITALADSVKQIVDKWQAVYDGPFGGPSCSKRMALAMSPATKAEWFRRFSSWEDGYPLCSITAQARSAVTTGVEMVDHLGLGDEIRQPFSSFIRSHKIERVGVDLVDAFVRSVFSQSASQVHTLAGAFALSGFFSTPYDRKIYSGRVVVELLIARFADNAYLNCPVASVEELALEDEEEIDEWADEDNERLAGFKKFAEGRVGQSAGDNGDAQRARMKTRGTDLAGGADLEYETHTKKRERGAASKSHYALSSDKGGGHENAGSDGQLPEQDAGYTGRVRLKSKKKRRRKKRFKVVPAEARHCKNEKARKKLDETVYDFVVICTPLEGTTLNILRRVHDKPETAYSSNRRVGPKFVKKKRKNRIEKMKKHKAIEEKNGGTQKKERRRESGKAKDKPSWVKVNKASALKKAIVAKNNAEDAVSVQAIDLSDGEMSKMNSVPKSVVTGKGGNSRGGVGETSEANGHQTPLEGEPAIEDNTEEEEEDEDEEEGTTDDQQNESRPATHLETIDVPERPFVAMQITCVASDGMVDYPMGDKKKKKERKRRNRGAAATTSTADVVH